ncbi:MAG: TetR/AcrR family transcriptional regulator [Alphaproteobacteria bacterium HGW-Alphaproteobacteria-18]|nr:MAG: TetR/AcrR family transcriptional regulator [Alphaproteobacteria bacterium HGW-Alphaproteobacteria-18]
MDRSDPPSGANYLSNQKAEIVDVIANLFRRRGYDGVSLGDISAATGLGKSSLYHHFPGGKEEMASTVVEQAASNMQAFVFTPLMAGDSLESRIDGMISSVTGIYGGGDDPCLLASLLSSDENGPLAERAGELIRLWADRIANALRAEGIERKEARRRGILAVALIQGGLITSKAFDSGEPFKEAMATARTVLLAR